MHFTNRFACVCLALAGLSSVVQAADNPAPFCRQVEGRIFWTLLGVGPTSIAPFDPAGRVLGSATGDLKGAATAIIKSANPGSGGTTVTNDLDVFVTGPGDVLWGEATATFTPIAGRPSIQDTQTLVLKGGTGRWANVVGTLTISGEGTLLNPPAGQVVGNLIFDVKYYGRVCKANFEDGWWQ